MTPAARMAIKATGANAPFDLPAEMVATVNEVGESRARDRAAKVRGRRSGPAHGAGHLPAPPSSSSSSLASFKSAVSKPSVNQL